MYIREKSYFSNKVFIQRNCIHRVLSNGQAYKRRCMQFGP